MEDAKFYDWLKRIPNQKHYNVQGYITSNGIPFYQADRAVYAYIFKQYPESEPGDDTLVYDPGKCREAARKLEPEIRRLVDFMDTEIELKGTEIDNLVKEINSLDDKDLLESVQKKVRTDQLHEKIGEHSGLIRANQILRNRLSELFNCLYLKDVVQS